MTKPIKIHTMVDCGKWLKSQHISAEIGIDYIFIKYEESKHIRISEKEIPIDFLIELKNLINCGFTISSFIPDPKDNSFPWYCRKKIPNEKGILLNLDHRRFGDSGGPIYTEDL